MTSDHPIIQTAEFASDHSIIQTAEFVIKVLEQGKKTATYKQAVLLAILDIVAAGAAASIPRGASVAITTRDLAERVIEIYWRQTLPFGVGIQDDLDDAVVRSGSISQPLKQSSNPNNYVTTLIKFQSDMASKLSGRTPSLNRAKTDVAYSKLVKDIETGVKAQPLPRLQIIDRKPQLNLYQLSWRPNIDNLKWTDEIQVPIGFPVLDLMGRVEFASESFQKKSYILLRPYVFEAFVKLNALLRSHVMMHWTRQVTSLNNLDYSGVEQHLFGRSRANLRVLVEPLMDLQGSRCFYCDRLLDHTSQVDHFLPWVRTWDDGLHNLVLADDKCNASKSDILAAPFHLQKWRERNATSAPLLIDIAKEDCLQTVFEPDRAISLARAAYQQVGKDSRLWSSRRELIDVDPEAVRKALEYST